MTKRLKYTKDILTHMLNNNAGTGGAAQSVPASASAGTRSTQMTIASGSQSSAPMTVANRRSDGRMISASSLDRRSGAMPTPGGSMKKIN